MRLATVQYRPPKGRPEAARAAGQPPILTHIGNDGTATLLSTEAYPALVPAPGRFSSVWKSCAGSR